MEREVSCFERISAATQLIPSKFPVMHGANLHFCQRRTIIIINMATGMNEDEAVEKEKLPDDPNDLDNIVKKELDAAVNTLRKRINSLKGIDASTPRRRRTFQQVDRRKKK